MAGGATVCALAAAARLGFGAWADCEYVPILLVAGLGAAVGAAVRQGRSALGWRLVSLAWLASALGVGLWCAARLGAPSTVAHAEKREGGGQPAISSNASHVRSQ